MYSATVTPELFFLRRKYKKDSLEGPSLAKVKDLEEQGWITHSEAHKELKELKAIRDDIHQEFSEEKNGAGAPKEEKDNGDDEGDGEAEEKDLDGDGDLGCK